MAPAEVVYRYASPSQCAVGTEQSDVLLATSGGADPRPRFFDGLVDRPRQTAQAMLLVAKVARTRFYEPPNSVRRQAALDPVVTAGGGKLRFESFSGCCGVYCRLDLLPEVLEDAFCGEGTTNVDFNPPMRQALGQVTDRTPTRVQVGFDEVEVAAGGSRAVERKVPLPERWVRGFGEVQVDLAGMVRRHDLGAAEARRFLQSLPSSRSGRKLLWTTPLPGGLRLSARPSPASVCIAGPSRLAVAAELGPLVQGLGVYGPAPTAGPIDRGPEPSAWEIRLAGARLWVVLSPEVFRGFSGEGGVLTALALGLPGADEAAVGRIGFDPADGRWFPRLLPMDTTFLETGHARLRDARALVEEGAVTLGVDRASVRTEGAVHTVRFAGNVTTCTCPWFAKHRGDRGPCKHVLAATMVRAGRLEEPVRWPAPT